MKNIKKLFLVFILISCNSIRAQENNIEITAPFYNLENNIKILNDSIFLNGYIVFEFDQEFKELGYRDLKKYFTFLIYYVFDINDISLNSSFKIYYNSHKMLYGAYAGLQNENDSIKITEKDKFIKFYNKFLELKKSERIIFRIEDLNLEQLLNQENLSFFQTDSISNKGYFIFEFKLYASLFVTQVEESYLTKKESQPISMVFFEPISDAFTFIPVNVFEKFPGKFIESNILLNYLELNK